MRISLAILLLFLASDLAAQTTQPTTQTTQPTTQLTQPTIETLAAQQAPLEAQIGLRLYEEGEDYRAITALQRYRILAGTRDAAFLAHLLTGQIYHRNARPDDAVVSFERATLAAKDDHDRTFAFLLATQDRRRIRAIG